MGVETVLLALLGIVPLWLVFDAGRERHRLRARMARATDRGPGRAPVPGAPDRVAGEAWRYWPLTLPSTDDGSVGPRL